MARAGMATLILEVRRLCNAGTADSTVGSTTYWTDDQIQTRLDFHRKEWRNLQLVALPNEVGSSVTYTTYPLPRDLVWLEQDASGSNWNLYDSAGAAAPSNTINYDSRIIEFAADTENETYYLDCSSFDLYMAVADIWETKAGFVWDSVDWASDNHRISASQEYDHCMHQAKRFRGKGGARTALMVRMDEV